MLQSDWIVKLSERVSKIAGKIAKVFVKEERPSLFRFISRLFEMRQRFHKLALVSQKSLKQHANTKLYRLLHWTRAIQGMPLLQRCLKVVVYTIGLCEVEHVIV